MAQRLSQYLGPTLRYAAGFYDVAASVIDNIAAAMAAAETAQSSSDGAYGAAFTAQSGADAASVAAATAAAAAAAANDLAVTAGADALAAQLSANAANATAADAFAAAAAAGGGGAGSVQPFWAQPEVSNPDTDEFEGLLGAWTLGRLTAGVWTTIDIATCDPVDLRTVPAAGTCRISFNTRRRSWLQMQPCESPDTFVLYKQIALTAGAALTLRTRMSALQELNTDSTKAGFWAFYVAPEDVGNPGRPSVTVTDGITYRPAQCYGANSMGFNIRARVGGSDTIVAQGPENYGRLEDREFVYSCAACGGGALASLFLRGEGDQVFVGSGADNVCSSGSAFVAFRCHNGAGGVPKVFAADYLRRDDEFFGG